MSARLHDEEGRKEADRGGNERVWATSRMGTCTYPGTNLPRFPRGCAARGSRSILRAGSSCMLLRLVLGTFPNPGAENACITCLDRVGTPYSAHSACSSPRGQKSGPLGDVGVLDGGKRALSSAGLPSCSTAFCQLPGWVKAGSRWDGTDISQSGVRSCTPPGQGISPGAQGIKVCNFIKLGSVLGSRLPECSASAHLPRT